MALTAYSELEKKSQERFAVASFSAASIFALVFILIGVGGVIMFGSDIDSNILLNMGDIEGVASVTSRLIYIFILMCQIPYFFFTVKEYTLVMYDEFMTRSMSQHLEAKLGQYLRAENSDAENTPSNEEGEDEDCDPLLPEVTRNRFE